MKALAPPPNQIGYAESKRFILRAHLYQARSLIGSDASGLSGMSYQILFKFFTKGSINSAPLERLFVCY